VVAISQHRRALDIDNVELAAQPLVPWAGIESLDIAARIDTGAQVLLQLLDIIGRSDGALARHDGLTEGDDAIQRIGPGRRIAIEREGRHTERTHRSGEDHSRAGHLHDKVLLDLAADGYGDHGRSQPRRVDYQMADGTGAHRVELVGHVGIEPPVAVDIGWLVEVGADLAAAVDGGEAESTGTADEGHVRRGEDHPTHRGSDGFDGRGAGLGAFAPDQGVDDRDSVGLDHDSGVGHAPPEGLAEPYRDPGGNVLEHGAVLTPEVPAPQVRQAGRPLVNLIVV